MIVKVFFYSICIKHQDWRECKITAIIVDKNNRVNATASTFTLFSPVAPKSSPILPSIEPEIPKEIVPPTSYYTLKPDSVHVSTDKNAYVIGEVAKLIIKCSFIATYGKIHITFLTYKELLILLTRESQKAFPLRSQIQLQSWWRFLLFWSILLMLLLKSLCWEKLLERMQKVPLIKKLR